jgi:hypothetical protein
LPKIPSAYKPYSTIWLDNTSPHWGTALSTDFLLVLLVMMPYLFYIVSKCYFMQ